MVRARFPGKPSKHFQRRKVSGVNSEDTEGILAADDVYKRLAVFNMLFSLEDEDNSFHGFSPHENGKRTIENISEENSKRNSSKRKIGSASSYRKIRTHTAEIPDDFSYSDSDKSSCVSRDPSPILGILDEAKISAYQPGSQIVKSPLRDDKKDVPSASGLPGVFMFPSRSAHSSRVIKPNKRFLESDTSLIPIKRPRIMNKSELSEHNSTLSSVHSNSSVKKVSYYKCEKSPRKTEMSSTSPVKFILRKPRLKIKTQPLSTVGGPFSSPSGSSFRGLKYSYSRLMKVCCGVCGYMCTYKFFRQARKFGIFSCESCRRFILKMIKLEREKQLQPLVCSSGTGNCAIRQSTLVSQPFSEEISCKSGEDDLNRCEGCWLNLCLRSFQMPQSLCQRLATYLPAQINQKPIVNPDSCSVPSWGDVKSITDNETRIFRRGRGARENIVLRRGSNTSLRLSSHRSRALREEEGKRQRGRQRLPLSGPRVKHVCRSASLVLGQPTATFLSSSTQSKSGTNQHQTVEEHEICENVESSNTEVESVTSQGSDRLKKQEVVEVEPQEKNEPISRPVARMLQDLGRANCELLDGMENHELEKQNAKVSIDFWESYDPEEVTQTGFPLIGFSPLTIKAVCFLCGSSGLEKMVHCASCCEPYHTFCVSNLRTGTEVLPGTDWWRVDWLCPKCTQCEACGRTGGSQVSCTKCHKAFHSSCITTPRSSTSDSTWVCPSCLFCKSCNGTAVHVFVGNIPLCKTCFKLRKKGSYCPLCQRCYDDNDYTTNMMECAVCKSWIHANCEGISNEKYQVLSYLPSHVEFVCKLCCKSPPAPWFLAVNAELKAGYLNVIKCLSKNKNACALLKASPKKQRVCVCLDNHRNPIHLPNLGGNSDTDSGNDSSSRTSPDRDFKCPDLGLLTPKLTKDDEESLKTVKRDFLNLVSDKDQTCNPNSKVTLGEKSVKIISSKDESQLLKIAFDKMEGSDVSTRESGIDLLNEMEEKMVSAPSEKKVCTCQNSENSSLPLNLMSVKNKASMDEYKSVSEFHKDMELVILDIGTSDLVEAYHKSVKQVFPWFDPNDSRVCDSSMTDIDLENKIPTSPLTSEKKTVNKENDYAALKGLLNLDQDAYYIGVKATDSRHCMLCKSVGEGLPNREGRLLYCGQNEWVHTNCALWSSEVFEEIDGSLQNVYSAISRARLIRCYECGKKGASLGCCARSCPFAYHFSCALSAECSFLENKEVYCKAHSNLRAVKEINKDLDFPITRSVYVELEHKKKKDVRRNEVRLFIGSLSVSQIGDILPELSDNTEIIIPCDYLCSRLYWSCKEPWKIVRYSIQTKVTNLTNECCYDTDTNYTVDHSLEFTPPPSPVETFFKPSFSQKDIRAVLSYLVDTVCSKEEEGNLSDQQSTDLFPPEIQDAIFKDLPQDFLDRVSVHDIFTKMSFDNILLSEAKSEKTDPSIESYTGAPITKLNDYDNEKTFGKKVVNTQVKKSQNNILKVMSVVKQKGLEKIKDHESYLDGGKSNHWKRHSLLQVDGAADLSESDLSNDSCDLAIGFSEQSNEDTPVKCSRCHRTYRTSNSYEKHIPTCNADYMSCSESDLSEEEKTQQGTPESENVIRPITTNGLQQIMVTEPCATVESAQIIDTSNAYTLAIDSNVGSIGNKMNSTLVEAPFDNSLICVNNSEAYRDFSSTSERVINISYPSGSGPPLHTSYSNEQTLVESVSDQSRVMNLQAPTQAIILHQVPGDNMLSTYLPPYQEAPQPSVQYISAINQEKTQYLTTASLGPQFQIQPQPMIQNVPTVLGTIIQPNGMEQLVLNNTGSLNNMDVYGQQQNNLYIANTPMIVGMETVVSNTVMSSSRFISGSAPGMLSASSYSATTTQVFQAAKPVIDIPQGYVVVSSNPPVVENGNCVQNIIQNGSLTQPSWNNYKINYQDAIKLNKNITYQTLTQQIVSQKQEINGIKLVDPREQGMQIIGASMPPKPCRTIAPQEIENHTNSSTSFSNNCNIIEVHQSHHNPPVQYVKPSQMKVEVPPPAVYKEKLHPTVAPILKMKPHAAPLAPAPAPVPVPQPPIRLPSLLEPPPQVIKCNGQISNDTQIIKTEDKQLENMEIRNEELLEVGEDSSVQDIIETQPVDSFVLLESQPFKETAEKPVLDSTDDKNSINNMAQICDMVQTNKVKTNGCDSVKKRKILHEEPKITYEITSEDGFSFSTTNIQEAWMKVFESVQQARRTKNLPPLSQNPFSSPDSMLKKLMGLGNNSVKYLLEQLPGISGCSKYKPAYHKKTLSVLEQELSKGGRINPTGCARTEPFRHSRKTYDMFSWLASRHRRPPKLLTPDNDGLNGNSRRATSMNLPMAMRFRHLKETSKVSVGVFRSDIHGRGLFCLRDIDSGEMVIEYAGEVIRSALTDKRERYYTEKGIGCYMFRIDDKFVVDATMKGNAARFINHSCEPNCYSRVIDILGKKHILIFALRRILQGEELTYDYKFPLEEEKINCHCLSRKCRKYLN